MDSARGPVDTLLRAERPDGAHLPRAIAPLVQGLAALLVVGGLVAFAGFCVAAWGFARRPTDQALATGVLAFAFAALPTHVLGWANALTRASLVITTVALCTGAIGASFASSRGRQALAEASRSLGLLLTEAIRLPWRVRSVALLGPLAVVLLSAWTALLAYYAPSSGWDGLMYHEPMVGFALQNEGFAWVGLEATNAFLGQVDGFPRITENVMLFLVVLWDRRIIDLVPSLLLPVLFVASYALFRRFVLSRLTALGFASGMVLIPGIVLQLRSTYVDVTFLTFATAAAAFLVKRTLRPADVWMAGLSLGLMGASKVTGLLVTPLLGAFGLVLIVLEARRRAKLFAHLAGAFLLVLAIAAPTFVRNWTHAQNLVWPSRMKVEALGIEWEGPLSITDMNVSSKEALTWLFGPPIPDRQYHDTKDNGYGNVPPFLILPLAIFGLGLALVRAFRGPDRRSALVLLGLAVPLLATFVISPARHWARLNLHVVLAVWTLATYAAGTRGNRLLAEGFSGALIVGGLLTLVHSKPAWDVDLERFARLCSLPAVERAVSRDGIYTLPPDTTARARERELKDGDLVVFTSVPFAGLLWNERFSNRIEWIDPRTHRGSAWLEEAERRGAKWAVVDHRSPLLLLLRQSSAWEEIGPADGSDRPGYAFRRVR